jgi:FtsP/CotA-like multicopper oxidase with cupredoxin domain
MTAPIPPMDPRPLLTMVDMGMGNMSGMERGNMRAMKMAPASPTSSATPGMKMNEMQGMQMGDMSGMDMSNMPGTKTEARPRSKPPAAAVASGSTRYARMPFPQPGPDTTGLSAPTVAGKPAPPKPIVLREGPQVDNVAMTPTERLAEPGNGLNDNGRRVLTYADLKARYRGADPRPPDREIELHLTGNMERFIWGFNAETFSSAEPIRLRLGERVRFILVNDTMMEHPIHLHGLWSELENGNGEQSPYKHTINVKPGERLSYLVSADTPGQWAYHCHLLYHMEAGMFRAVIVS